MLQSVSHFLGNTDRHRVIYDGQVALNNYAANRDFEEWHSHQYASLSFLLSGTHQEDIGKNKYVRHPGDMKFIPAGELHRCHHYSDDARKINIALPESLLVKMAVTIDQIACSPDSSAAKFTMLKFHRELQNEWDDNNASLKVLCYELLHPGITNQKSSKRRMPQWAIQLKALLTEELHLPLEMETIALRLNVHPVTISRYFPHYFGCTLSQYIRQLRVEKSLTLIKRSSLTLTEIAFACGFADQSHFSHTFKSITGYLPKEFRNL